MAGFIRRFSEFPGVEVLTAIEGVNIIDLPPPGAIEGVSTGVVALIGEFADCSYAAAIDGTGAITTFPQPVEIVSGKDLLDKLGGKKEDGGGK